MIIIHTYTHTHTRAQHTTYVLVGGLGGGSQEEMEAPQPPHEAAHNQRVKGQRQR